MSSVPPEDFPRPRTRCAGAQAVELEAASFLDEHLAPTMVSGALRWAFRRPLLDYEAFAVCWATEDTAWWPCDMARRSSRPWGSSRGRGSGPRSSPAYGAVAKKSFSWHVSGSTAS